MRQFTHRSMDPRERGVAQFQHHLITHIVATHCCICRAALLDAKSVELGVGPTCRKRYGEAQIPTTPEMLENALGYMAISPLPPDTIQAVLAHKWDGRQVCNLLVKFCSAHYHDKKIVLAVTPIIRSLGYLHLAEKLEEDRTALKIKTVGAEIECYAPYSHELTRSFRGIPGAHMSQTTRGRFKCWCFPEIQKALLLALLGVFHGGKDATGDNGVFILQATTWADVQAIRQAQETLPAVQRPCVPPTVRIEDASNGRIEVFTPYDATFVHGIGYHGLRFNWNSLKRCWHGPASKRMDVVALLNRCYGVDLSGWDD